MPLQVWCHDIGAIIILSDQMRKEADDVGPRAELEHWKRRMAKFNSLTEQVKAPMCTTVVRILQIARSHTIDTCVPAGFSSSVAEGPQGAVFMT